MNQKIVKKFVSEQMEVSAVGKFLAARKIDPARIVGMGMNGTGIVHVIYAEGPLSSAEEVTIEGSFLPGMNYLSAILKTPHGLIAEGARELIGYSAFPEVVHAIAETTLGVKGGDLFFATPKNTQVTTFVRTSSSVWTRCFAVGIDAFGIRPLSHGGYVAARGCGIIYLEDVALKAAFSGTPIELAAFKAVKLQGTPRGDFLSPLTRVGRMRGNTIIARLRDGQNEIVSFKHLTPERIHGEVMKAVSEDVEVIGVALETRLLATLKTGQEGLLRLSYIPAAQATSYQPYIGV